ncbi:MipA/OmpV family protein [Marinimicrobium sp. ARAG 43.8]|uniref:MipA/OmpV family protein n=1 Tax=Marinimicrobium sp. ARAG 43.8 TaxID=3418719 RepID=UPI003CF2162D
MSGRHYYWMTALLCLYTAIPSVADASSDTVESRLEAGLGVGALITPDYRGSKTYRSYVAPVPYVIYRGKIIRSDREGVRSDLFSSDQMEFTLSLAASILLDGDKNERRIGMPKLGSTLELGPALNINVTGDTLHDKWMLSLPVRAVFTLGRGSPEHIGWLAEPQLSYRLRRNSWNWTFRMGPSFASESYHEYYYGVGPEYARPDRAQYRARGGYSGFNSQLALSRRAGNLWYAFFVRYYNLNGADFMDSSLVETDQGGSGGLAISWVLF